VFWGSIENLYGVGDKQMVFVMDTNIYMQDFSLGSSKFRILKEG